MSLIARSRNRKDKESAAGSTSSALTSPVVTERADTSIMVTSNCKEEKVIGYTFRIQHGKVTLTYLILHLQYDSNVDSRISQQ